MKAFKVFLLAFGTLAVWSCTREDRAIVRTVVDLVDEVCGDKDSIDDCLGKAQSKRASMKAAEAAPSASASAPAAPTATP